MRCDKKRLQDLVAHDQMIGQPAGAVAPSNAIDFLTLVTNLKVSRFEPLSSVHTNDTCAALMTHAGRRAEKTYV